MDFLVATSKPSAQGLGDVSRDVLSLIAAQAGKVDPRGITKLMRVSPKFLVAVTDAKPNAALTASCKFPHGRGLVERLNSMSARTSLTELCLRDCNLKVEGGRLLAEFLRKNTTLVKLDVSKNSLGQIGGIAVADAVSRHSAILEFNVSRNSMGLHDAGMAAGQAFASLLQNNSTLTCLDISFNALQKDAVHDVILQLTPSTPNANHTLSQLNLSGNILFGYDGNLDIAEMIEKNQTLANLSLENTNITSTGVYNLIRAMRSNTKVKLNLCSLRWTGTPSQWQDMLQTLGPTLRSRVQISEV